MSGLLRKKVIQDVIIIDLRRRRLCTCVQLQDIMNMLFDVTKLV